MGRVIKYKGFPHLTHHTLLAKPKAYPPQKKLTEVAWTTLVQAGGLDKLDRLATLAPVKVTTLDTRQHLSMLGDSTNS